MNFKIITLFPEFFYSFFRTSLLKKAVQRGIIKYHLFNPRKYGEGNYRKVDDLPFGGKQGHFHGMLLKESVLKKTHDATGNGHTIGHTIFLSPRGKLLTQSRIKELAKFEEMVLVCGHYEGVDERFIRSRVDEELSIGDYILAGGETAALVLIESISRLRTGFMGNKKSQQFESFTTKKKIGQKLLESDQYTRPVSKEVPEELLSGDRKKILNWSHSNALINTFRRRPDLIKKSLLTPSEEEILKKFLFKNRHKICIKQKVF